MSWPTKRRAAYSQASSPIRPLDPRSPPPRKAQTWSHPPPSSAARLLAAPPVTAMARAVPLMAPSAQTRPVLFGTWKLEFLLILKSALCLGLVATARPIPPLTTGTMHPALCSTAQARLPPAGPKLPMMVLLLALITLRSGPPNLPPIMSISLNSGLLPAPPWVLNPLPARMTPP